MSKGLEESNVKKENIKNLFMIVTWGFLLMLSPLYNIIWGITSTNQVNLITVLLKSLFLFIIGFIAYKVSKSLAIKVGIFLKIYIGITLGIYIFTLSFIIINNILLYNNICFKGNISMSVLLIGFINMISIIIILFTIGIKVTIKRFNNDKPKVSKSIVILFPLIICLFLTLSQGILALLLSIPEEIQVVNKEIKYNIRVEGFLRARHEASFIYNQSINPLLMRRLKGDEIPKEILAENNHYYSKNY